MWLIRLTRFAGLTIGLSIRLSASICIENVSHSYDKANGFSRRNPYRTCAPFVLTFARLLPGLKTAGRRLLAQNCPATYPLYYAGTCFLCPEANPVFSNLQCYANDAQKTSGKNGVKATPQPIKDPKPTRTVRLLD